MTERKKLVLVDGNSLAYRAFFALPLLSNEKGIHTNAVYGFTTILMKMLEEEKPTHMLVAFDAGKTTFRHKTFKEYKGGRQKTPPELSEQLPFIRELLDAYQISRYELENYEADDIIGTLAKSAEKDGFEVKIFSGDKDLTQLATEGTTVAITKKGITDVEYYTPEHVREKYGLTPEQIIDMKGLMGDSSDNIPGVPGVGEKTAIKLLKQFHTVEELLSSIDEVSGKKLKEKLEEFKEQALMSKELATITTEAPLEVTLDSLGYEGFDREAVVQLFKDLGFNSLLERIGEEPGEKEEEQFEAINVKIKTDITDDLFVSPASLVVEQLGDNYHEAPILGFSIVNEHGAFFIPEETAVQSDRFKEWAEDESKKKWVFDAKRAAVALRWRGIELKGAEFDVLLAAYIINPGHSYDDVASVAKEHQLHIVAADEAVYGKGAKQAVPAEKELADHLARKAKAISLLREKLLDELEKNEQLDLFEALEMPLAHILGEMESIGVQVDVDRLKNMGEELSAKLAEYEKKIHESAGETFNINSPKQLGVILFEKLGLPAVKKQKQAIRLQPMCWKNCATNTSLSKISCTTDRLVSSSPHMLKGF